jgi:hypothetical protein
MSYDKMVEKMKREKRGERQPVMAKIIREFVHRPGVHCGSTALMNVMNYYGHQVSEALCFGVGSGLGFVYLHDRKFSPSYIFNGRSRGLEPAFFENLGMSFQWREGDEFPWAAMKNHLDQDQPILLLTDLFHLEYYRTKTHFSGHGVVLAGYDEIEGNALLSDTERMGLQKTSLSSLANALVSKMPPYPISNYWFPVDNIPLLDIGEAMKKAILRTADTLLNGSGGIGLHAMEAMAQDLPQWSEAEDWKWCARFGYQVIEKRGTGGSAFRQLYVEFLEEAARFLPELEAVNAPERMRRIARKWTVFADYLYAISEQSDGEGESVQGNAKIREGFANAAEVFGTIIADERSLFIELQGQLNGERGTA